MESPAFLVNVLTRNVQQVQKALDGMDERGLRAAPDIQRTNPAGWLVWHQARFADLVLSHAGGKTQAWAEGNWSAKFPGVPPDPKKTGLGDTMDQVMALNFPKAALSGYLDAVLEKARSVLSGLAPADFDREIGHPIRSNEKIKIGDLLAAMTTDFVQHSGQVCYLRGYLTGPGWR
ncbi:MAG: DinB family protein [Candidatus Tectomicrobia bacterium]|uniref:DinB family protein n=1 Tax=Tectimicrobiota bacterium TaxID=2528274 RepID=A0A932ZXV4_UNCTE|nr:DinB family protein [Candidatus Tectomicrobia bacterium]MBI4252197.1 DinB family protein [Candidatus Tectomicrobia bacterium]